MFTLSYKMLKYKNTVYKISAVENYTESDPATNYNLSHNLILITK